MTPKECDNRRQRDITFVSSHPSSLWTKEILTDLVFLKKQQEKDEVEQCRGWFKDDILFRLELVEVISVAFCPFACLLYTLFADIFVYSLLFLNLHLIFLAIIYFSPSLLFWAGAFLSSIWFHFIHFYVLLSIPFLSHYPCPLSTASPPLTLFTGTVLPIPISHSHL